MVAAGFIGASDQIRSSEEDISVSAGLKLLSENHGAKTFQQVI